MNQDTVWNTVRGLLFTMAGFAIGAGWGTDAMWTQIIGAVGMLFPLAWDWYVKWNTTPVLDTVIERRNIPAVSSLTGQVVETKK